MKIMANVEQLPVSKDKEDVFFRELEISMQRMGHLTPFREKLNWSEKIDAFELGNDNELQGLKKAAAKNDGTFLLFAKLSKGTVFQHIILHPNNHGFYLPFRFDEPFYLTVKNKKIWFGSSIRLTEELNWLQMTMEKDQHDDGVVEFWRSFRELCRKSTEHFSPFQLKAASGDE